MYEFLVEVFKSEKFWVKHLDLIIAPQYHSITARGLVQLREHEKHEGVPGRFQGVESNEIKNLLRSIDATGRIIIETAKEPKVTGYAVGAYAFTATQNYEISEELEKEMRKMHEDGVLLEHVYTVNTRALEKLSGKTRRQHC